MNQYGKVRLLLNHNKYLHQSHHLFGIFPQTVNTQGDRQSPSTCKRSLKFGTYVRMTRILRCWTGPGKVLLNTLFRHFLAESTFKNLLIYNKNSDYYLFRKCRTSTYFGTTLVCTLIFIGKNYTWYRLLFACYSIHIH